MFSESFQIQTQTLRHPEFSSGSHHHMILKLVQNNATSKILTREHISNILPIFQS